MSARRGITAWGALLLLCGVLPLASTASAAAPTARPGLLASVLQAVPLGCNAKVAVGVSHCYATALGRSGRPLAASGPTGLGPTDIQSAYHLGGLNARGRTVAVIDAFDDKSAEGDLAVYRAATGLSPCTSASGCFRKVNQTGGTTYPKNDVGWATEVSLDLDAVSAACPSCKILLVEASSDANPDLYAAVRWALSRPDVVAVSNSYGSTEAASETADDANFSQTVLPVKAITVSSGDHGYGVEYPAASRLVTAVGGTTLTMSAAHVRTAETAWNGAGSGCSKYETKPSWQHDTGCPNHRTVADVSAVADPNTGLGVYDSNCDLLNGLLGNCTKGWLTVGGTSLSAPIVAAVYALTGTGLSAQQAYGNPGALFDITSGSNGSCSSSYLCTAKPGYDGPTGLGTPNGTGAF